MEKQFVRIYYSGYLEKEIPQRADNNEIEEIRMNLWDTFTKEEIEKCITEDDWGVYPSVSQRKSLNK